MIRDVAAAGLLSAMAGVLLLARFAFCGRLTYGFLGYNLILGLIPMVLSVAAVVAARRDRHWLAVALFAPWLAFFPNAPYLVTDLYHLHARDPVPYWYDIALLSSYGMTGLLVGLLSLRQQAELVRGLLGRVASWAMVIGAAGLSGLAIYIGRFLRWNSWDLVVDPVGILADLSAQVFSGRLWGVTLLYGGLILGTYLAFAMVAAQPNRDRYLA